MSEILKPAQRDFQHVVKSYVITWHLAATAGIGNDSKSNHKQVWVELHNRKALPLKPV